MASGGARGHSGPARDPQALRRDRKDDAGWVLLPARGRDGEAPSWPLSRATKRELELWVSEWRRPQAVMWERNGQEVEVALYVRSLKLAEMPKAPVNSRTLVKQQQEALGISLPGLTRNGWRIDSQPVAAVERPVAASARDLLYVVGE